MTNKDIYFLAAKRAIEKIEVLEGGWELVVLAADSIRDVSPFPSRVTTREIADVISQMKYLAEERGMTIKRMTDRALSTSSVNNWCNGLELFEGKAGIKLGYPSQGEVKLVLQLALELEEDKLFTEEDIDELSGVIYEHAKKKRFPQ